MLGQYGPKTTKFEFRGNKFNFTEWSKKGALNKKKVVWVITTVNCEQKNFFQRFNNFYMSNIQEFPDFIITYLRKIKSLQKKS